MPIAARPHFRLTSPSKALDRRIHAVRGDLADIALAGRIFVPHYATPSNYTVISDRSGVFLKPESSANMVSELLRGEAFAVLDRVGDWAWGYCGHDGYVGYVRHAALGNAGEEMPRQVSSDYVDVALTYLETLYLWGGRSHSGIDCSGLVQVSLAAAGLKSPRDADQQMAALGSQLDDGEGAVRGDLIFFPGHVGVMIDKTNMVHATGFYHKTVVEPLATVVARIAQSHVQPILARKRLR